jgi:RNA polymerase sigma factor (sigma-70 family)
LTTKKREPSHVADRRRAAWMVAAQAGDRAAYAALLRDCIGFIQAVARRQGVPPDLIDDVVQETLLAVHGARHTYDPRRSFSGWLAVIAQRRAIDVLRSIRRRGRREVHAPPEYENHPDESMDPERRAERADTLGNLNPAIAALPEKQRQAVRHLLIEERSLSETAALTGDSKIALKVNLHRALRKLRILLNKDP